MTLLDEEAVFRSISKSVTLLDEEAVFRSIIGLNSSKQKWAYHRDISTLRWVSVLGWCSTLEGMRGMRAIGKEFVVGLKLLNLLKIA